MGRGFDVSRLIADFSNPDPCDPYKFNGVSHAPAVYDRVFRTCDDVVAHIAQAKVTRGMDDRDIMERTGVGQDALARLVCEGKASLSDFLAVTEALGVRAVCVPNHIIFGTLT